MKLTAKLAYNQIKVNRNRSIMTLIGIVLSSAMLTAIWGFIASAKTTIDSAINYDYRNDNYNSTLITMGVVLGAIIIYASVIVISNAFRVSAGERTRQFGILKSTGATKKQIAASVLYEGVFFSIIGIPIGIVVGLFIEYVGITVMTNMFRALYDGGTLQPSSEMLLNIPFTVTPIMFLVAGITSFATVLFSAWLPARKAAKIPAIDAIRNTGEVKFNRKTVRSSKWIMAVFGFEGTLAEKSIKRSKRSFRATVVSLTISVILLITAGYFGELMKQANNVAFVNIDATAYVQWLTNTNTTYDDEGVALSVNYIAIDTATAEAITEKLRSFSGAEIFGVGETSRYETTLSDGSTKVVSFFNTDNKHYEELCKTANVPVGSNILINMQRESVENKKVESKPYDLSSIKDKPIRATLAGHEPIDFTINGELTGLNVPNEIARYAYNVEFAVLVPNNQSAFYEWYANVDDVEGFLKYAEQVVKDGSPKSAYGIEVSVDTFDISKIMGQMNYVVNTIMFFVYGFVGMLALIAATSIISTVSTNIRSRGKEFAILESTGMTKSGIKKMLNLESILCTLKSLMFGLPLGIAATYALYLGMGLSVGIPYSLPWLMIIQCMIGVFAITWITMRYSASRLKSGSIVETIRGE